MLLSQCIYVAAVLSITYAVLEGSSALAIVRLPTSYQVLAYQVNSNKGGNWHSVHTVDIRKATYTHSSQTCSEKANHAVAQGRQKCPTGQLARRMLSLQTCKKSKLAKS